jgi:dihydroxy-acid dehydratase
VISEEFRKRYLSNPKDPNAFEAKAIVFDGPENYHATIDDPTLGIDENTILFMRGTGPLGYPGAAEVVNMRAPTKLLEKGVRSLPCVGDGRQSGTSGSPSILNASPEAAAGGGLAILEMATVRVDLNTGVECCCRRRKWPSAVRRWRRQVATRFLKARRHGRKFSAPTRINWPRAWC